MVWVAYACVARRSWYGRVHGVVIAESTAHDVKVRVLKIFEVRFLTDTVINYAGTNLGR